MIDFFIIVVYNKLRSIYKVGFIQSLDKVESSLEDSLVLDPEQSFIQLEDIQNSETQAKSIEETNDKPLSKS